MPNANTKQRSALDFRGFDDWVEIFKAGRQTDSQGRTRDFTEDDLDQVIANHSADDAAPIVIGHPKTNDPAFGWTGELKRERGSLFAKFRDVEPTFSAAVESGRYRKRSVRLAQTDQGLKLMHVGFLGAMPPAISGLQAMNYATPEDAELLDFEMDAYTPGVMSRVLRRLRDWMIERDGLDTADKIIPDYEIDGLDDQADRARRAPEPETDPEFNAPQQPEAAMPYSEEEMRLAKEQAAKEAREAAQAEFSQREASYQQELANAKREQRKVEFQADIDRLIDAGTLMPAQVVGMTDFMLGLAEGEDAQFEFSVGDGKTDKKDPAGWFRDFLKSLPKQVDMGESDAGDASAASAGSNYSAPEGYGVDPERAALDQKARDYMRQHPGTEYLDAVTIIEQQGG